jgi:acyl-CoA synthetase (NDP forming)
MHSAIAGLKCYAGVMQLPDRVDLANAAVPAKHVPRNRHVLGERKIAGHPRA